MMAHIITIMINITPIILGFIIGVFIVRLNYLIKQKDIMWFERTEKLVLKQYDELSTVRDNFKEEICRLKKDNFMLKKENYKFKKEAKEKSKQND